MHHDRIEQRNYDPRQLENLRAQIAQLERSLSAIKSDLWPQTPEEPLPDDYEIDEQTIRRILKGRRSREQQLGPDLFSDPAWDILLEALLAELAQVRTSVSGLCFASSVPATTALRWIKKLEEDGWLVRTADPFDGRRQWLELTPAGSQRLRRYFRSVGPNLLLI